MPLIYLKRIQKLLYEARLRKHPVDCDCYQPKSEILGDLIVLIFRRIHPTLAYIGEQNGVIVTEYVERETCQQAIQQICYMIDDSQVELSQDYN